MLLINRIFCNNPVIWIFSLLMIGLSILLQKIQNKRWFYIFPPTLALIQFLFFNFKNGFWITWYFYKIFYIAAIVAVLPVLTTLPFLKNRFQKAKKIFRALDTTFCILAGVHTIVMPFVWDCAMRNHTHQNYVDSFISTTRDMEKYYSLKDWKKIDIPALREKLLPVIQKAQDTNDIALFGAAMTAYTYYFYDGHVSSNLISSEEDWIRCLQLLSGHDYGLSMLRFDDGKTLAINVEENSVAWQNGIREKTVITSWNGIPIDDAIEQTEFIYYRETLPVKETENLFKPVMLATKGMNKNGQKGIVADLLENAAITQDSERPHALVGFIDQDGNEQQLELEAIGPGLDRFEKTYILLYWSRYNPFPDLKNLETVMINEDTAYMARYSEQSDTFHDVLSYFTSKSPGTRKKLIKELAARKNEGMKKLIIDARINMGGFWALGAETASLFTTEAFDIAKRGTEVGGKKKILQTVSIPADGRFSDIQVILLVDNDCVSAGDSLVKVLSQCPNVTVMGLTPSNCSCQETGGISYLSDSLCNVVYPVNWLYEVDDNVRYIDTDETRECTLPLDVKIPFTYELVRSLYDNYETRDIILEYALDYLK